MIKFNIIYWHIFLLLIGVSILIYSIYKFKETIKFINNSTIVIGEVVEIVVREDSDGSTDVPIYEYNDNNGKSYRNEISVFGSKCKIGAKSKLAYDNTNPANSRVLGYLGLFGYELLFLIISLIILVIPIGYIIYYFTIKNKF